MYDTYTVNAFCLRNLISLIMDVRLGSDVDCGVGCFTAKTLKNFAEFYLLISSLTYTLPLSAIDLIYSSEGKKWQILS